MTTEKAILAGGCFWGVEESDPSVTGCHLHDRRVYGRGCAQCHLSKSRDACRRDRDPSSIRRSYHIRKLLEFFFQIHDPTTRNRQGNDVGTSYRSAIFYVDEQQKETAQRLIAELNEAKSL